MSEEKMALFRKDLATLINKYSLENGSDTPDFLLAEYLVDCLYAFNTVVRKRNTWYGIDPQQKRETIEVNFETTRKFHGDIFS